MSETTVTHSETRALLLRIVVMGTETDVWCEICALPVAVTLTYLVEPTGEPPAGLYRLTYCENCENG